MVMHLIPAEVSALPTPGSCNIAKEVMNKMEKHHLYSKDVLFWANSAVVLVETTKNQIGTT